MPAQKEREPLVLSIGISDVMSMHAVYKKKIALLETFEKHPLLLNLGVRLKF
jgi:hypothetical protein